MFFKKLIFILAAIVAVSATASAQDTTDKKMEQAGLVDIHTIDPTIKVELMYATDDNFVGRNMYGDLKKAYFLPHFAKKIAKAHQLLKAAHPTWRFVICDGARPISVQREMYRMVEGTPNQVYVANGEKGGRHNFGVAIDLTIIDGDGHRIDMGSTVDYFGEEAHLDHDAELAAKGLISKEAVHNRRMLVDIMKKAGLVPYVREWWHYEEPMPMKDVRTKFKVLDF